MPPLRMQRHEAGGTHHLPQEPAVRQCLSGDDSAGHEFLLLVNMAGCSHVIHFRTHRDRIDPASCCTVMPCRIIPGCLAETDVNRHSVVVHTAAVGRIGHIVVLGCIFHGIPHRLLYAHRACSIEDTEAQVGTTTLQLCLRLAQRLGTGGQYVCIAEVAVEYTVAEVVRAGIHQCHLDGRHSTLYIHQPLPFHRPADSLPAADGGCLCLYNSR